MSRSTRNKFRRGTPFFMVTLDEKTVGEGRFVKFFLTKQKFCGIIAKSVGISRCYNCSFTVRQNAADELADLAFGVRVNI